MTEKLGDGDTVYKITEELWERSYSIFLVDVMDGTREFNDLILQGDTKKTFILSGVKLECRPHGITDENTPLYARTGKVAAKAPFPEDVVR